MKNYVYRLLLLLTVLALAGCGEKKTEAVAGEAYKIYYLNTSVTKLAPYEYHTETTDTELLIQELMEQFLKVPNDVDSQAALSDKVGYRGYRLEERILYLYFDGGYSRVNMDATREILCRAALTKTMTQLEGVDYISIYVADQPLLDLTGKPVGLLADTDFIESISDVNTFEKIQITLYFADETGEKLVEEDREVVHSMNTSLEKLVVEELLKGPEMEGNYPTLPSDVKLLNVSVSENVCYVNFDSNFLNNSLEVKELIPIYSIVNSLCAISNVNKVQLTVNGSSDVMFRDVISLNTQFERNLDLGGFLDPVIIVSCLIAFIVIVAITRYVSLGSITIVTMFCIEYAIFAFHGKYGFDLASAPSYHAMVESVIVVAVICGMAIVRWWRA